MSKILIFILANLGHCWGIQDLPAMMPHTLGAGALNEHLCKLLYNVKSRQFCTLSDEVEKHHGPLSPAQTIDFVMRHR